MEQKWLSVGHALVELCVENLLKSLGVDVHAALSATKCWKSLCVEGWYVLVP